MNALALFEQAASVETAYFDSHGITIYHERILAKQVSLIFDMDNIC